MYFTDENTLGLGKLLRRAGRDDVLYPGHEDLVEVPLGAPDLDWMPCGSVPNRISVRSNRSSCSSDTNDVSNARSPSEDPGRGLW
jgi:hypothetical protein